MAYYDMGASAATLALRCHIGIDIAHAAYFEERLSMPTMLIGFPHTIRGIILLMHTANARAL